MLLMIASLELQKFLHKIFRQSFKRQSRNEYFLNMDMNDQVALDNLIKLRNYFRRKYQRIGFDRYKLFRNILNNYIKATLIKNRNEQ